MTIVRVPTTLSNKKKAWHLLNDEDLRVEGFQDWQSVVQYIIESKSVPTMITYQKRTLNQPATDRRDIIRPQASLNPDQLDILFCQAKENDDVDGFMENEELQRQQMAMLEHI